MVMPRSRSRSLESMTRSTRCWCAAKVPDCRRSLSTSVVLPWSTWAMIARLRIERDIEPWKCGRSRIVLARQGPVERGDQRSELGRLRLEGDSHAVSLERRAAHRADGGDERAVQLLGERAVPAESPGEREQVVRLRRAGEHDGVHLTPVESADQSLERPGVLRQRPAVGGYLDDFGALGLQSALELHVPLAVALDHHALASQGQVSERFQ